MAVYTLDTLELCHSPVEALRARIEALAAMPAFLSALLGRCAEVELRRKPSVESFSVLEQICHLRDIEIEGYAERLHRTLTEERPFLPGIDGSRLSVDRAYNKQEVVPAFMAFREAREKNLARLRQLAETELQRTAVMDEAGEITLAQLIAMWASHDASHRQELTPADR